MSRECHAPAATRRHGLSKVEVAPAMASGDDGPAGGLTIGQVVEGGGAAVGEVLEVVGVAEGAPT